MEASDTKDKSNQFSVVCSKIFHLTWYRHDTILQINNKVITDKKFTFFCFQCVYFVTVETLSPCYARFLKGKFKINNGL